MEGETIRKQGCRGVLAQDVMITVGCRFFPTHAVAGRYGGAHPEIVLGYGLYVVSSYTLGVHDQETKWVLLVLRVEQWRPGVMAMLNGSHS
jgi:hypothetical protein